MRVIFLITLFFNLSPSLSLAAENYTVGRRSCDFQKAEEWYHNHPKENAMYAISLYGICLVLKGIATNDPAMESQGLIILDRHNDETDGFNDVYAMFFVAEYFRSGGTFTPKIDEGNIDMAIRAFERTLLFINVDREYPSKHRTSEEEDQMEIKAYSNIPKLYGFRFNFGRIGSHNRYLNDSPSYTGDKNKLNFYLTQHRDPTILDPNYSDLPVIIDSLHQVISSAEACLNLPYKYYHRRDIYDFYQKRCAIFKETAETLLPLEHRRQDALYNKSCARDVLQCNEYIEVYSQIENVTQDTITQLKAIPNPWR